MIDIQVAGKQFEHMLEPSLMATIALGEALHLEDRPETETMIPMFHTLAQARAIGLAA